MTLALDALRRELDGWAAAGRTATLWWRDDDATDRTPALDRLADKAAGTGIPVALAVVPIDAREALGRVLERQNGIAVVQHGYAHRNHAPPGAKKAELATRAHADVTAELRRGAAQLATLFGHRALPVLVPPWNRIDPALTGLLPTIGFRGLSTYGRRASATPVGLLQVNTHADIIDWHGMRSFIGLPATAALLTRHLADRRLRRCDPDEPTGLLSHHLVMESADWDALDLLFQTTMAHPAARWLSAQEVFRLPA